MALVEMHQIVELSRDINPVIVKGMVGVVQYIYVPDKVFEVEFPKEDDEYNYKWEGHSTFTVNIEDILLDPADKTE